LIGDTTVQYDMDGWSACLGACGALLLRAEGSARRPVVVIAVGGWSSCAWWGHRGDVV